MKKEQIGKEFCTFSFAFVGVWLIIPNKNGSESEKYQITGFRSI